MNDTASWTFGSLRSENFGYVESRLQARGIQSPILLPEMIDEANRRGCQPYETWARRCIENCKQRFAIDANIEHCFIASFAPNAFASRTPNGTYYIALFMGVMEIGKALYKILGDPDVRDFLGLRAVRETSKVGHDGEFSLLLWLSFQWLVYHELGHIKNGHLHLRLGGAQAALFEAAEAMQPSNDIDRNITMHTLEMDADAFAAGEVVFSLLNSPRDMVPDCSMLESPERKLKAFYIAMYTMMRSFDNSAWKLADLYRYSHPPGVIRALGLGSWGFAFADKITLDLPPMNWIEYSTQAAAVVERSMQNLGNPFVLTELANFFPDGFVDYVRQRLARWAKIRPGLEPHTLGQGRLAPPQEPPA